MSNIPSFETFTARLKAHLVGILLVFLIIFFLIAGVLTFLYSGQRNQNSFLTASYRQTQEQYDATRNQLGMISFELEKKKNELGQEQTKTQVLVGDNSMLKELFANQQNQFARTLKNLEVKVADLQSVANFRVETSGQFLTITKDSVRQSFVTGKGRVDTVREIIQVINFQEQDGWFSMTGTIKGDSMNFRPTFREEYDLAIFKQKRKKKNFFDFFPGKLTVGEVTNRNPYSTTKGLKIIAKKPKKGFLGIF